MLFRRLTTHNILRQARSDIAQATAGHEPDSHVAVTPPPKAKPQDAPSPMEPKRMEFDTLSGEDVPADKTGERAPVAPAVVGTVSKELLSQSVEPRLI